MNMKNLKQAGIALLIMGLLVAVVDAGASDAEKGWRTLFNGTNLDGWEFRGKEGDDAPTFKVEDGAIVGRTTMPYNPTAFVCTTEPFKDFELVFDIRIDKDLNGGVQVRSALEGNVRGAQVEIQNDSTKTGYIFGQGMGMWLSEDISPDNKAFKANEWNHVRVLAKGKTIKTWINDRPVADTTHEKIALEGVIGLQVHGYPRGKKREAGSSEVLTTAMKNIKIRELGE